MKKELKQVIHDARQWIEQERVWGNEVYATSFASSPRQAVSHPQQGTVPTNTSQGTGRGPEVPGRTPLDSPLKSAGNNVKGKTPSAARPFTSPPTRSLPVRPLAIPPRASPEDVVKKTAALLALYERYKNCTRCPLGSSRLKFVFGVGNPDAQVLFIGEGPGYEEDHRGEPFIGRAGQLLDKMMEAIGLSRKTVYIANIVKCHAMINPATPNEHGNDRAPTPLEAATCSPILQQQIAIIKPRIIVTLGSPSTRGILGSMEGISKLRGRYFPMPISYFKSQTSEADFFEKKSQDDFAGFTPEQLAPLQQIQVLPMYHPAALLRNPNLKKDSWEDMKLLRDTLLQKPA